MSRLCGGPAIPYRSAAQRVRELPDAGQRGQRPEPFPRADRAGTAEHGSGATQEEVGGLRERWKEDVRAAAADDCLPAAEFRGEDDLVAGGCAQLDLTG